MLSRLVELFEDNELVLRIRQRLPRLFQIAEVESSRAGKIGMEVGTLRERVVTALLIYKFGEPEIQTEIPITEPETDVILSGYPISIKTFTTKSAKSWGGVKLSWTVDAQKAQEFVELYSPKTDILLVRIIWGKTGGLYFIPLNVQRRILALLGNDKYFKLPKPGTNPRGVEVSCEALRTLVDDEETLTISIDWRREQIDYNPYHRWIELWEKND